MRSVLVHSALAVAHLLRVRVRVRIGAGVRVRVRLGLRLGLWLSPTLGTYLMTTT